MIDSKDRPGVRGGWGSKVRPPLNHSDLWLRGLLGQEPSIVWGCDHFHNTVLLCPCEGEKAARSLCSSGVCVILKRSGCLSVCVCVRQRRGVWK